MVMEHKDHDGGPPVPPTSERAARVVVMRQVRRWLEEAWRHGEVVVDEETACAGLSDRPVDRFQVEPPAASAEPRGQPRMPGPPDDA